MAKNIHVTNRADKTWAVIGAGNSRASSLHKTQGDAINAGKNIAMKNHSELVIHDRNNRIRDKDSYGNDPISSVDTKF